jgi:hypothetical protein
VSISYLEEQIKELKKLVEADNEKLRIMPDDVASFFSSSMKSKLDDLSNKLYLERAARAWESIEFHLSGNQFTDGSVPLRFLAKLSSPLNNLIESAAWYLRNGDDLKSPTDEFIRDLDLRLGGVSGGSSKLYIVGRTSPDLSGDSALATALEHIFSVFQSDEGTFLDSIHAIGVKATKNLQSLVGLLEKENVSTEVSWNASEEKNYQWRGRLQEVSKIRYMIENVGETQTDLVSLEGEVVMLSRTGRITLQDSRDKGKLSIRYPTYMYKEISELHLGAIDTFWVNKTSYFDKAKQSEVNKYFLVSIGERPSSFQGK